MNPGLLFLRAALRTRSRKGPLLRVTGKSADAPPNTLRAGEVRVAAVQMPFRFFRTGEAFARALRDLVQEAVQGGAELVVFPEDLGSTLLGILPRFERLEEAGSIDGAMGAMGDDVRFTDVISLAGDATRRIYETVLGSLARSHAIYIQGGSILLPTEDGRTFNVGYLYGPKGNLLSTQAKCHLLPMESEWGLAAGEDLSVLETPLGKLAHPICMDATFFETFRILSEKGAEIVCLPTADPDPHANPFKALRGLWPRVQEAGVYGIQSTMVGGALGMTFSGRSAIMAPFDLTPKGDGYLAESEGQGQEIVFANLDMEALRAYRKEPPIRPNRQFEQSYFPAIYQGFWRGGPMG